MHFVTYRPELGSLSIPQNWWPLLESSKSLICCLKRVWWKSNNSNALSLGIWYSQFTCCLIFIPTPATKFQSCDKNICSIDQTPSLPSDLKKGWSLGTRLGLTFMTSVIYNYDRNIFSRWTNQAYLYYKNVVANHDKQNLFVFKLLSVK